MQDDILKALTALADQQQQAEQKISELEEELKIAKEALRNISSSKIPELLEEAGVSEVKLANGKKLIVKDVYAPTVKNPTAFHRWLREQGFGDIIKNSITASFGMGEESLAESAEDALIAVGCHPTRKEVIHHSTLKAFAKEQMEAGTNLPESINVFVSKETKIK